MNIVGELVTLVDAADPGNRGRKGRIVLETAKTLRLDAGDRTFTVEKKGTVMLVSRTKKLVSGEDVAGRLEDRLRAKKR